jgi:putative component of membrane protein insertase Oxa1/YidC/SpoIIIJ protein YidD
MISTILFLSMLSFGPLPEVGGDTLLAENKTKVSQERNGSASPISPDFQLLSSHIPSNPYPVKKKPSFLLVGKKKWIQYNPVNLTFGGLLFLYQSVISSQISADCPYEISCSNFSKQSILQYGLIKGLSLSADRLTRCTKLAAKDLHPLRISKEGMLIDTPAYYCNKHKH